MASSFVAYIDESGDEGFTFRADGSGSSRWFVLSAVVVRKSNDLALVAAAKQARSTIKLPEKKPIHFCKLAHAQRVVVARIVGQQPIRTVSVLIHKPSINDPERYQQQAYTLYRYASRLLLERVSWLCRDHRKPREGDGKVDLIYSNRSAMSYQDLRQYLSYLRNQGTDQVRIDWGVLDEHKVRAVNHDQLAGLQLADVVASSVYQAVNPNLYGDVEERYFHLIAPTVYHNKQNRFGYGLKFWCDDLAQSQRLCAVWDKN